MKSVMARVRSATRGFRRRIEVRFYLEAWQNPDLARACIQHVRTAYPKAGITLFSDGDPDPAYKGIGQEHSAEVIYGERLWIPGKAGLLWKRRFEHFMSDPAEYLFKIDTDTAVYRPFLFLPKRDAIFGTLRGCIPIPFITGGFIGMKPGRVAQILDSGILDQSFLRNHYNANETPPINNDDRALGEIAQRLGLPLIDHPEVSSLWKKRVPNPDLRFAVVHPCKDGKL